MKTAQETYLEGLRPSFLDSEKGAYSCSPSANAISNSSTHSSP